MGVSPRDGDLLAPESRHNRHVSDPGDLRGVGDWSAAALYRAVEAADDGEDGCVVVDYGRSALYLAAGAGLTYYPPRAFGIGDPPALAVADPRVYDPEADAATAVDDRVVSPEFDILVPAFDWAELDEDDLLPPIEERSESPTDAGTGASG